MPGKKSAHNACPVCGKPRVIGPYEFAHGMCAEIRAATEGKKIHHSFPRGNGTANIKTESYERGMANQRKKRYASGKLPPWMFD